MSWTELERLVGDAEADGELRRLLRSSRSQAQLLLNARRQGYHITRVDLWRACRQHQLATSGQASGG